MANNMIAVAVTPHLTAREVYGGIRLFFESEITEGGNYVPPQEIFIPIGDFNPVIDLMEKVATKHGRLAR